MKEIKKFAKENFTKIMAVFTIVTVVAVALLFNFNSFVTWTWVFIVSVVAIIFASMKDEEDFEDEFEDD